MKKFIYLILFGFLLNSCSSSDDSATSSPLEVKNIAPTVPLLIVPTDNKLCIDNSVLLQWNVATDANNDAITYKIEVSKDNVFSQIVKTTDAVTNSLIVVLEKSVAYYWRIKATDSKGLSSDYSSTYKFYTAGDAVVNHLPFSPEIIEPFLNAVLNATTATLKWNASDVDITDVLAYDVYFGSVNPPVTKISSNITIKMADVTLETGKEYFWKVVVKDNKGGETIGQVWKFKIN